MESVALANLGAVGAESIYYRPILSGQDRCRYHRRDKHVPRLFDFSFLLTTTLQAFADPLVSDEFETIPAGPADVFPLHGQL
jgi:hypothetical protein